MRAWIFACAPTANCSCSRRTPIPTSPRPRTFAQSALTAGMSYDDLLHRILQLGENYPAAWRGGRSLEGLG